MPFACLAENFFSLFDAIKDGKYSEGDFVCTYSFDATYLWGFFALLALVFLVDIVNTIKHGEYHPHFRSSFFWTFFIILARDYVNNIFDGGGYKNKKNLCILLSQVPGINCGQVLGVLITYVVFSAAMSYYINLYYFPYFLTSSRPRSYYHFRPTVSYPSLDKSTQTEETETRPAKRSTYNILPDGRIFYHNIPQDLWDMPIGCSINPQDLWKPSPTERDLLFRAQWESGSSFASDRLREGFETVASVASGMVIYLYQLYSS
ncbi:hypothetical protein N431DRAFT_466923 [Stipitochalara longipes BDJ]|nr:hypothetical protein N431DRAFT_466923 [Stipitochalara longipes BDJ]